ncbi:unnamed protein product, partial [Closterium sp. NIES-54]
TLHGWGNGATGPAAGGASGASAAGGAAGAGAAGAAGPGGAGAGGTGAVGGPTGVGAARGVGAVGAGAVATGGATGAELLEGTGAVSAISGGAARLRPYYVPLLQQVLGLPPSTGPTPPLLSPPPVQSQSRLQPASPLPGPSPYSRPTRGLTERREPESCPASRESRPASPESCPKSPVCAVCTGRCVPHQHPPPVPGTHSMTLRPSTPPQRVPLLSPPTSSLPAGPDPKSNSLRAASPTVTRFLATAVTDPSFESTAALVAASKSASICPLSVGGECPLGTDVLEDRQEEFECFAAALPHLVSMLLALEGDLNAPDIPTPRSYAEAIEGPYSSQWQTPMDAEMASWKSTGTYVDEVPPPGANIVSGMWIFRVKRAPGSPPVFCVHYVARGFSQRQGVDFFQTFSPTRKMTTLRLLLHIAAQRNYKLHSLEFSTAFLQGSLHEVIWLRRPPRFTGPFHAGTQWSLRRPVYGLRQSPREWQNTLMTTLAALGFAPSTADLSLFLRTNTTLLPFYVLVYVYNLVFAIADTEALAHVKSELQKRHTCTDLGELTSYLGLRIIRDRAQLTITLTQSYMVQQVLQPDIFTKALQPCDHQSFCTMLATAAIAVVLERQMVALRIEEDELVEEGVQKFFDLLTRLEGADLNYSELLKMTKFLALLAESWSSLIINLNRDLPCLSLEDLERAILQEDFRRRELAGSDGARAASISRGYGRGRGRGRGGRFGGSNNNGGRGSGSFGNENKNYGRGRGRFDGDCQFCHKSGHMWRNCYKILDRWTPCQTSCTKNWNAENKAKVGVRFREVKVSGLEHVELPLELSSGSTITRQSPLVNGGEEARNGEEEGEEVQQTSKRAPTLPSRATSAPRIRVILQQHHESLHASQVNLGRSGNDDEESEYEEFAFAFFSPVEMLGEPGTLKEALESSDAEEWKKAMESELKSIEEKSTWELVELPEGRSAITSKWLFKIKSDADGKIDCYKSRLVAKGY